ncbi:MAG TPA: ABC transporter permease subunit [Xanthobacteraceae bacterium]|nr:ABC transporter permease subunit [Xanthobacteraceae bacterium]
MRRAARRLATVVLVLLVWEGLYRAGLLNPVVVGSPSLVYSAMVKDGATFLFAFRVTAYEILVASAIAWLGGVAIGVVVGANLRSSLVFSPIFSALIAVPLVVLYPVIVAWTGIGPVSKIIYGAAAGFFPIALAAVSGIRSIDLRYAEMARAMGATRLQILTQVLVRLALPAILSGLRIGTALVIISVIQSEMLSSVDGLGFWISYHRSLFNVGQVYFGIILVLATAAIVNLAVSALERRFGRRPGMQQAVP